MLKKLLIAVVVCCAVALVLPNNASAKVFSELRITDSNGAVSLTVPQGRAWRIMSIGGASLDPGHLVLLSVVVGNEHAYSQEFRGGAETTAGRWCAAIGIPDRPATATPTPTVNQALPDVRFPAGSVFTITLLDDLYTGKSGEGLTFVIEDED